MAETAKLTLDGKTFEYPVVVGSEKEKAVDISKLRAQTGYITLDEGYGNTGSCTSAITFIDGDLGILRYRGIPIEEVAEKSDFVETCYLLIYGKYPSAAERRAFDELLDKHARLPEGLERQFANIPPTGHPMAVLASAINQLACFYPGAEHDFSEAAAHLISKGRAIAGCTLRNMRSEKIVPPKHGLGYVENFLHVMFGGDGYKPDPVVVRAIDLLFILHADHEQNCSTSTVRMVGSAQANLFASAGAGVGALWGPLHGGANQEVLEMLEQIIESGDSVKTVVERAKKKDSGFRLFGFGHRVYKNFDPRARIIKKACDELLGKLGINDPLLGIAKELEEAALQDPYFVERKLYPNVDFYSGIIMRALGIPTNMFTVLFAIGRMPGWIANWKELRDAPNGKICRPRQVYTGPTVRSYESAKG